jgi:hypothetical protein
MYVFTEWADAFDRTRRENHEFLDQSWDETSRDWADYIAKHGDDPAYMTALHNMMFVGKYFAIIEGFVANDGAGTVAAGFVDFLRIGDGVKKGGWGYAQDALRLLMVLGPIFKLAGIARIGIVRVFQMVDPGGEACAIITARAALMLSGIRHFISLSRVFEAAGTDIPQLKETGGITLQALKQLLADLGASVSSTKATGSTVEEALINAVADNPRTTVVFGVKWEVWVEELDKVTKQMKTVLKPVGHAMIAFRNAATGALRIFDRSAMTAYDSLAALEKAGYTGISQAALVENGTVLVVDNSTVVNLLEDGTAWAQPISAIAATAEAIEAAFPRLDMDTGVRHTSASWILNALALEVRSVPFRVSSHSEVHVPLRATTSKASLVTQKAHFHRDLYSDGAKLGWTDVSVDYQKYTVQPGDTLASIAKVAYGDARLWKWIARTNGIAEKDANTIQPGWVLRVLPLDIEQRLMAPVPEGFTAGPWLPQDDP